MRPSSTAAVTLLGSFLTLVHAAPPQILVYSRTAGYRHDSIPVAIDSLATMAQTTSLFNPTFSEDPALFTPSQLAPFSAIVFLSNSDEVLDDTGKAALEGYLKNGGGLIGLHAATACLFTDLAFGVAMGSWFDYHPDIQNATFLKVISHPTIDMLPDQYNYIEEVYNFRSDPRSVNATVLLTVDSSSYVDAQAGTRPYYQGSPHPIAWYRETPVDMGNGTANGTATGPMWMTSLGHTNDTWRNELHLAHVQAGIQWTLERVVLSTSSSTSASASSTSSAAGTVSTKTSATSNSPATTSGASASSSPSPTSTSSRNMRPSFEFIFGTLLVGSGFVLVLL